MSADGSQVSDPAIEAGRSKFREMAKTGAVKFDQQKPRMDLLPMDALLEVSKVLTFGAKKYAAHNWCAGMPWGRLLAAALRHIGAFMLGENKDPETGLSHLAHAACCILFLLAYEQRSAGTDDRYKPPL